MTAAISLEKVAKHYGALAAVEDVTLELGEGQTVALVGHNGAGKTTLFKLMLGLTRSSGGTWSSPARSLAWRRCNSMRN